jgi:hypothetical protein
MRRIVELILTNVDRGFPHSKDARIYAAMTFW